jgi:hypothetical protein
VGKIKGTQKNAKGTVNLTKTESAVLLEKIFYEFEKINQRVETLEKTYSIRTADFPKLPAPEFSFPDYFVEFR